MTKPKLPEVGRVAERLAHAIRDEAAGARAIWQADGPPTAGKTALASALAARLDALGFAPIVIAPSARSLDAGPTALIQLGVALKERGLLNGQLPRLTDPAMPWAEKIQAARGWVNASADRVVLICDDPLAWRSRGSDNVRFSVHASEVADALLGSVVCRRVAIGRVYDELQPLSREWLRPSSNAREWLQDSDAWGGLAAAARALDENLGPHLERHSPLEVRLLVAHVALTSAADVARWYSVTGSRRDISARLVRRVASDPAVRAVRDAWARLALLRRAFPREVVDLLSPAPLDGRSRELIERCLLYPREGSLVLHETLRLDAYEHLHLEDDVARDAHRRLADHYVRRFTGQAVGDVPRALLDELEAFHHAASSADCTAMERLRAFFVDQLDALGRSLSRDRQYDAAVAVFRRALEWDERDDYAHHYLAYNLDVMGREADDVERHYLRAIDLDSRGTWWRSRWITYLITRGRSDAARSAWNDALDALGLPDPEADPVVYENLHIWVARLLLHRGQFEFAQEVLGGIPVAARERHIGLRAIERRLRALVEARLNGAVFPLSIPPERQWEGPHLFPGRDRQGRAPRWLAGRIDSIDEGGVHLYVAEAPGTTPAEAKFGQMSIPVAQFDRWSEDEPAQILQAGRFVEIVYHEAPAPVIRVHRDRTWADYDLPPLWPDPVRYMRRDGWVR